MNPTDTLGLLVHDISRLIRGEFEDHPDMRGVTQADMRTIIQLARMEGCRQVELACAVEIRPITLGKRLDRLERLGLIARVADPADRRAFRLHLTPRSRGRLERVRVDAAAVYERAMRHLPPAERTSLIDSLRTVRGTLLEDRKTRRPAKTRSAHV